MRMNLVTAVGQQEEKPMSRAASSQVVEEFQADVVAPVQVFHHKQQRTFFCLPAQEVGQGLKAPTLLLFGIERCERWWRRDSCKHVAEIREQGKESLCERLDLGRRQR